MKTTQLILGFFSILTVATAAHAAGDKGLDGRVDRQTVEFRDSEVPYFQAVKKGSKMKVSVVEPTAEKPEMEKVKVSQTKLTEE